MTKPVRALFEHGATAFDIWEAARKAYTEIDCLRPNEVSYSADVARCQKVIEDDRVYDFLGRLDPPYDGVRSRILSLNSISPPLEAYAMSMVTLIGLLTTKLVCVGSNTWIIGTSASDHMTCDINLFDELSRTPRDSYITSANGLPFLVPAKQNDVFERKNRQLLEVAHSLMIDISVPHYLWGHGVLAAAYLINRTPSQVLDFKTPLDVLCAHTSLVSVSKLPSKGEKGSKLESLGLQDLGRKDVGEDSTYCDIGEKIIGRPSDSDRTHRSRAEDDALVFDMTGRQDGHDQSPGYDPEVDAFGYEAIVRQDDDDRSPGLTDDVPCVSCEDEFDTRPPSTLPLPKSNHDTESSERKEKCEYNHRFSRKGYIGLEDQLEENMPGEEIDRSLLWRKAREDKHGNILDPKDEKKARLIVRLNSLTLL
ncbi:hypothetical protein L3X38_002318 [Prunus dulcis]|uniref:Uncharacterized protein n=1 Tax=Prunus dulcis TaxID=3755 RepID=A0AAD4ZKZ6_PRUDU|nr:hypothetical protein L3X38_002318 [Prunus dulcis]